MMRLGLYFSVSTLCNILTPRRNWRSVGVREFFFLGEFGMEYSCQQWFFGNFLDLEKGEQKTVKKISLKKTH